MSSNHPPSSPTASVSKLRKMSPIHVQRSNCDNKDDDFPSSIDWNTRSSPLSPVRFSSSVEADVASFLKDRDEGIKQSGGGGRREAKFAGIKHHPNSQEPGLLLLLYWLIHFDY